MQIGSADAELHGGLADVAAATLQCRNDEAAFGLVPKGLECGSRALVRGVRRGGGNRVSASLPP